MVRDVTAEAFQQFEEEHQMVLGALRAQIQGFQVHTWQAGTVSTSLTLGMATAEEMLHTRVTNTIVLPQGALVIEKEANRPIVNQLKGVKINMAMLPQDTLYVLQDGVTVEMQAREGRMLQVMSKQCINIE